MAGETEDIVLQLTGDTKQFERSIRSALGIVKGVTSDMVAAFERAGLSMDGAGTKATRLQKQIEALTGVNSGMKDRAADIEAYGVQLDSLRAKYNPLFAAQQQYTKSLAEINQAARAGALTEKERVAAITKTKSAFADQVKSIRSGGAANTELAASGKLATYELVNLSRQIQDVGVQLVGGQGLFTIIAQQGPQALDIFASSKTGTVGGAIKQIGSGIASVITPMRLLGVATAATGALALASLASWKSYTLQLDDTAKSLGAATNELSKLQAAASFKGIGADDFTKGMQSFGQNVYEAKNNMGSLAVVFRANNVYARDFEDALGKAADIIKNAKDDQTRLQLLQQMGLPATMQWVRLLSGGKDGLAAAKSAAVDFGRAADDEMIKKAREFDEAWNRTTTNFSLGWRSATVTVGGWINDLIKSAPKFGARWDPSQQMKNALLANGFKAGGAGLTSNSPVDQFYNGLGSGAPGNNNPTRVVGAGGSVDPNVVREQIAKAQQYLSLLGQTTTATEARRQVELQLQAAALNGVGIDARRAEILKKLAEENILGITAMKQQADSYRVEAATIGMSVGQATAYAAAQNALNDARRNGRALTAQNIADINKEAQALGAAAQAAAQLRLASDIKFERSQIGLSDSEQSANARVRATFGGDVNSAQAQFYKQQLLVNDALRQYSDIGKDATKGFISDILAGKSALESLGGALEKIGNKLLDMAVDGLWSKAFGGGGGGLLSLLGGGGGSSGTIQVGNQLFPKFANGTNFAPGGLSIVGERGPELVNLPRGASVTPNSELMSMGGVNAPISISIDARGADAAGLARVQGEIARLRAELPSTITATVRKKQYGGVL